VEPSTEDEHPEAIFWNEADYRCELWSTDIGYELRVYRSNVLTHREAVRATTRGLQQAAELLARTQARIQSHL
jgi:hypothetical protein